MTLSFRQPFLALFILFAGLLAASALFAWTGPTATAPGNNVATPINVGTTDQVKNAGLSLNALTVFGSQYIQDKLGINKTNPVVALQVVGTIIVGNGGEVCQAVTEGGVRYNSSSKKLEFCNGSAWTPVTSGTAGSQMYSTPGTYVFTVPDYNSLTVTMWGGGGGGDVSCGWGGPQNTSGGASTFGSNLSAGGGSRSGSGGVASGGDSNANGGAASGYTGGSAPGGGSGGAGSWGGDNTCSGNGQDGNAPGGGGGAIGPGTSGGTGGGGGGARVIKMYSSGDLTPGSTATVVVGDGGSRGSAPWGVMYGGRGARGEVQIAWQ